MSIYKYVQTLIVYVRSATLTLMVLTTTFYVWFKNETEIISDSDVGESGTSRSFTNLSVPNGSTKPHIIIRALTRSRLQRSISTIDRERERKRNTTQLIDLIRKIDSFEIFMQHLAKEYSMENLLAIVEFIQFKYHILMDVNFRKNIEGFEQTNRECLEEYIKVSYTNKRTRSPQAKRVSTIMAGLYKSSVHEDDETDIDAIEENILQVSPKIFQDVLIKYGMEADEFESDEDDGNSDKLSIDDEDEILDVLNTLKQNLKICDRKYHINTYNSCFIARDAVSYMVDTGLAQDIHGAVAIGQKLVEKRLIKHVKDPPEDFKNEYLLFQFRESNEFEPIINGMSLIKLQFVHNILAQPVDVLSIDYLIRFGFAKLLTDRSRTCMDIGIGSGREITWFIGYKR